MGIPVPPYEPRVVEALVQRKTVMGYPCNEVQGILLKMWQGIEMALRGES
jgi:hypothetical protein